MKNPVQLFGDSLKEQRGDDGSAAFDWNRVLDHLDNLASWLASLKEKLVKEEKMRLHSRRNLQ